MCDEKIIRRFAGVFILLSLALGRWVHPAWFLFTAFVGVSVSSRCDFASPKSSTLTPVLVTITFPGFKSRCTMPLACAAARASAISAP